MREMTKNAQYKSEILRTGLLFKVLFTFILMTILFGVFSVESFAGGGNGVTTSNEYTIIEWRKAKDKKYQEKDFYNKDILCSSSTASQNVIANPDDNITAETVKCDMTDNTVHRYPAWKVLDNAQPFVPKSEVNPLHASFSATTYLFSVSGASSQGWRQYTGADVNGDGVVNKDDYNKADFTNSGIHYAMVYLHRMTKGFDLYENFRTTDLYAGSGATNYDNVSSTSPAYYLTNNNGSFRVASTVLYYNTVPHVLGTEGSKNMIVAIMDEGTGRPVPVKLTGGATGFSSVRTKLALSYNDNQIAKILQGYDKDGNKYFPYFGDALEGAGAGYTTIADAKASSWYDYNAFTFYYSEKGVTKSQTIDMRKGLQRAIILAGGPQYIGTVEIALSEAITQRNSAYAFMSSYGNNGGNYSNGGGINSGSNAHPEDTRGVYNLAPRGVYYYLNGNVKNMITPTNANVIQIRLRPTVTESSYTAITGLNRNFKHSFATFVRGACYTRDGVNCYQRVMFNYFNDIELKAFTLKNDDTNENKTYFGYELKPKTATCGSKNYCTLESNNGISTFYYSKGKNGSTTGKYQYSDKGNAWGVWRQIGWSASGQEMGGGFAADTYEFPKSPTHVQDDWSNYSSVCRYSWSPRYHFHSATKYNPGYIEHYITKSGKTIPYRTTDNGIYNRYEEMTDVYLSILRVTPDALFRTFNFAETISKGTNLCDSWNGTYNASSAVEKQITAIEKFKVPSSTYDKIAAKLCENLGLTCSNVSGFKTAVQKAGGKSLLNNKFANSYLAIIDALKTKDENNITYAEHMAYAFYNYYTLVSFPDEYTTGQYFRTTVNGGYYSFADILLGDKSNVIILNEETRLDTPATGNVDKTGSSIGTNLDSLGTVQDGSGNTVTGQLSLGTRFGPELYLINESDGSVYVPGVEESELTCPKGYTKNGNKCEATHIIAFNRSCRAGYAFDFQQFKCVETASGITHCPADYALEGKVCVSYTGAQPICATGQWDNTNKVCLDLSNAYCNDGYTLKDTTEANKILASTSYTFSRGNGDLGKFTSSGVKNFIQNSDSTVSYDLNTNGGYIQLNNLNLDATKVNLIQIKMKNTSISNVAKIYYTTNTSTGYNEAKSKTFEIEPESDETYYTYTIDMSGGMWKDTITGLRFVIGDVNKGTIIIDNIALGAENPNYKPNYKCVQDLTPVCPKDFTLYKGRCYGYASKLSTLPDTYELDCSHIVPKDNEAVDVAAFRVGNYVNFEHGASASVFTVPVDGKYYIELWGASNGTGNGGYTSGMADLKEGEIIYVYTAIQNSARSTTVYKGGLAYENILATATANIAGTNNLSSSGPISKITKAGNEWMKKTTEIGNTTWTGENGHVGNGFARITLYSAAGLTAQTGTKVVKVPGVNNTYGYTGGSQSVTLDPGTYTLEVWGARGGQGADGTTSNTSWNYGKGGYSSGIVTLDARTTLYIQVGGSGLGNNGSYHSYGLVAGGYNGGGNAYHDGGEFGGSGGGATHIATRDGVLSSLSSYKDTILIVAGGGGGSGEDNEAAGHGGGYTSTSAYSSAYIANQSNAGTRGSFGQGANYNNSGESGGGGGGGYYGGGGGEGGGSGGGSGYVKSTLTSRVSISGDSSFPAPLGGTEVGHNGSGYARIHREQVDATLGYYILEEENSKEIGVCLVHDKSINLSGKTGLELYVNNGYINKCGAEATCEEVIRTERLNYSKEFSYTGSIQSVTLDPGTYTLEVWGAQGGTLNQSGGQSTGSGKGGYSTGTITLTQRTTLYIGVGGKGNGVANGRAYGGWNGGGDAYGAGSGEPGNGGGGATHIAFASGTLSSLSGNKNSVLIVAGGGGGMGEDDETGGYGGGINGGSGNNPGGSQTSGYAFGQGAHCYNGGAAGGGYYGGYTAYNAYAESGSDCNGGSGGSGYVNPAYVTGSTYAGNTSFVNTAGTGNETGHTGNGYARISGYTTVNKYYNVCSDGTITEIDKEPDIPPAVPFHQEFGYTGSVQTVTLQPGTYKFETWGAAGGDANGYTGGKGGYSYTSITLNNPTTINILVGGQGGIACGGGGSFVYQGNVLYVAAGGGGGAGHIGNGGNATGTTSGGSGASYGTGGTNGNGGTNGVTNGEASGGGGWLTAGGNSSNGSGSTGGAAIVNGGAGGSTYGYTAKGGFGGGGGGWYNSLYRGGGGGGYSGGAGGSYSNSNPGGQGGGSYIYNSIGSMVSGSTSFASPTGGTETGHSGNGYVKITGMAGGNGATQSVVDFGYTGEIKTATLTPGTYKLEVWGAEGGTGNYAGGKGGYSTGTITLTQTTTVYIGVGGAGTSNKNGTATGGFNGGGNGYCNNGSYPGTSGGGATHIALASGTLSSLSGNKDSVLIVAGGGGGAGTNRYSSSSVGGYGGGTSGGNGSGNYGPGTGGSQSNGGTSYNTNGVSTSSGASFGQGSNIISTNSNEGSGGGGGYYGGGSGGTSSGAGGGSGYVNPAYVTGSTYAGNTSFINTAGTGNETGHTGNGYARITAISGGIGGNIGGNTITQQITDFYYTGSVQPITLEPGTYQLETWGAQGGDYMNSGYSYNYPGGKGGYSSGIITLNERTTVYVYVGGKGSYSTNCGTAGAGGWNGGGSTGTCGGANSYAYGAGGGGGGATDIRIGTDSLYSRVIVAGGGGGSFSGNNSYYSNSYVTNPSGHNYQGGYGGGITAGGGGSWCAVGGNGGGQTGTNRVTQACSNGSAANAGTFGQGSSATYSSYLTGTGGGGGWYGGQAGGSGCGSATGGGGSGYVYTASTASYYPAGCTLNSSYYLSNTQNLGGNVSFAAPSGGTEVGHTGNGHARITVLSGGYQNYWNGMSDNITYQTTNGPLEASDFTVSRTVYNNTGWWVGDVLIGQNYLYLMHSNMQNIAVYTRNADGTIGSYVGTTNWYSNDNYIQFISTSSTPTAYTTYYKDGVTKLVGWSRSHSAIFEWTINESNHTISDRTQYNTDRAFSYYGRAAWDGEDYVYFVDGRNNGSSEFLYKFNVNTKAVTYIGTLSGNNYSYSSYTGAAAYIDKVNNHIYLSEATDCGCGHSFAVYNLANGAYVKTITAAQMHAAGVRINGSNRNNMAIMIDPTHPSVGWAMSSSYAGVSELYIKNNNVAIITPTYIEESTTTYSYTGNVQTITLEPGRYKLEAWGAQGGNGYSSSSYIGQGGKGGYSAGFLTLTENTTFYLYVGGKGGDDNAVCTSGLAGWNGGGSAYCYAGGGGGATDIRMSGNALANRIIVAGGGGGGQANGSYVSSGGYGGGHQGGQTVSNGNWSTGYYSYGATQTSGGTNNTGWGGTGTLGVGGNYHSSYVGGGGGGYYGGAAGAYHGTGGSGGSGYVGGVTNGYMFDGSTSFPGTTGVYETGHSGNGAIKITKIKSISANSGICSMEARIKIIPTCTNGVAFDVATNKCTRQENLICKSGYKYNDTTNKCEAGVAPVGCTNDGIIYKVGSQYFCKRETTPTCDMGYHLENGGCVKDEVKAYQNELCPAPYEFVKANRRCEYKEIRDIMDFNEISLEGDLNNVEVGKIYKYTNYVGYRTTSNRGAKYVDGGLQYARSALFPTLNIDFTLVAPNDKKLASTEICRVCNPDSPNADLSRCDGVNYATDCKLLDVNGYETYHVTIPAKVSDKTINGGLKTVLGGNRANSHMISSTPDGSNQLSDYDGTTVNASESLWSMWQGIDKGFVLDSDFTTLWSEIDVYFQFNEDNFCFYNAPSNEEVEFASRKICVPYTFKEGQEKFIKVEDGVNKLNMTEDENGETNIKNIFITTSIGSPSQFVDSHFNTISASSIGLADAYMDNTKYTDDRSDFISGFKLAPDGDVFIDRFEVLNATTNEVVFAAEAMTKDRCTNGYEFKTGSTALYTQTTIATYDNGVERPEGEKVTCKTFDPTSVIHVLDPHSNYYVKVYTKYIHIKESNIAAGTPASMNYISLDIQHLGNSSAKNVLTQLIPSMNDAALSAKVTVRTAGKNPDGTCALIKHRTVTSMSALSMLKGKPADNKCQVSSIGLDSIKRFYTKDNNYMLPVSEPNASAIIPANGLLNKGITDGLYNVAISAENTTINAYSTWDTFPFNYYLGEGPDVKTELIMRCTNKTTGQKVDLTTITNACVLVNTSQYENCDLYAKIENIGNKEVEISTNIRVNTSSDTKANLDVNQGELYNADGSSKYFLTDAATYGGHESFKSTSGGTETGHAGNGYARITNIATGAVVKNFGYTGSVQTINLDKGTYKLEVWGAQGGSIYGTGGKGGYSVGTLELTKTVTLSVYVGGQPTTSTTGGWNGGGPGQTLPHVAVYVSPGGGATDIRVGGTTLNDRIIIAGGGGGGAKYATNQQGGPGGGNTAHFNYYSTWGTAVAYQSENYGGSQTESCRAAVDKYGANVTCTAGVNGTGATGGGGGYYGGGYYATSNRVYSGSGGSGYVRISTTKNKLTASTPQAEVLIKSNVTGNLKAVAIHNATDNDKYADVNWTNNYNENCWLFDYTNYSISNVKVEPSKVWVPVDGNNNPLNGGLVQVDFKGSYEIHREYDTGANKNIQIDYVFTDSNGNKMTTNNCTFTPVSKLITDGNGSKTVVEFTGRCGITFKKTDINNMIALTIKINGGKNGTHAFTESDYTDNEEFTSISVAFRCEGDGCKMPVCDDTCTKSNSWGVNFDFMYTFNRNVISYTTSKTANMTWTDYDIGTKSGETQTNNYSVPISSGNIKRAPDDYMAFKSDKIDKVELCTDYKSLECWRYEMNVSHNVTYYRYSQAVTSVYPTHKTLTSSANAGICVTQQSSFNGETYGGGGGVGSGTTHGFANSNNQDRLNTTCHGFTESPNNSKCAVATDWWGNEICDSFVRIYSDTAPGGSHPADYIPYEYFQDYTLLDGEGMSPTTKTDRIIMANQISENKNQGAAHPGWVQEKTMDVCDLKGYMNISYSCRTYFKYGTDADATKFNGTTKNGSGVCYPAGSSDNTRTCAWENTTQSPPETTWWNDSGATCYRLHVDYNCDNYYGWSDSGYVNNSGNTTTGTCTWQQTGRVEGFDRSVWSDSCHHMNYSNCTGDLNSCWSCDSWDKYHNCTGGSNKCHSHTGACEYHWYTDGTTCSWTLTWTDGYSEGQGSSSACGTCYSSTYTRYHTENSSAYNISEHMSRRCSSGDMEQGVYCYETYNDSGSLVRTDERCIRWTPRTYKEIKYYTTSSGDSGDSWVSRTYENPKAIWQYTCDTKEPTVAYPNDTTVLKTYTEEVTATSYIKTQSSGNQWIQLNFEGNTTKDARPRSGEWFDLKFVTTYKTTRATKPSPMPYLTNFYNNYHNILGGEGQTNTTVYPTGGYNHFGVTDSGKTNIGDGKTMIPRKFADIVNNTDYGYCNARPAEPYGCSYNGNQFMYPGQNNINIQQGHTGAQWTTNQQGNGVCYYGPDNKTVWKKFEFGNNYYTALLICAGDSTTKGCEEANALATSYLNVTSSKCKNVIDGLCTIWEITWGTPERKDATGKTRTGFYLDSGWDNTKNLVFDLRGSKFNAVGQYEKELLGTNALSSNKPGTFFELTGNPIKPLCVCQTTKSMGSTNDYKWGSSEWEVE